MFFSILKILVEINCPKNRGAMSKTLFHSKVMLAVCFFSMHFIEAAPTTRVVNSTSDNPTTIGTLPYWLLNADVDDTIDCSTIAGQQIILNSSLPAITKSYTINGAGIIINANNTYQAFQVASGTVVINNINVQNAISKGGNGGDGYSGAGGAVGGGGAFYVHGDTSVVLAASSLTNNIAQGGNGGSASNIGNSGAGGGGGFGGGNGGSCLTTVSTGGGGGGHSNGGNGGSSSSKNGNDGVYFGGGGGGAGINSVAPGGSGGNADPTGTFIGGAESGGNGGGGAGDSQNGYAATGSGGSGIPGNGGNGIGVDSLFGGGGGGGCASETGFAGGVGVGAAGGGGGSNYSGGTGGILGGGGGGGLGGAGGEGGFGAGGGGAVTGGIGGGGFGAGGGNGASDPSGSGAGGGGSALGGAIFVQKNGHLTIVDALEISGNTVIAGVGGSSTNATDPGYIAPGNGAAMGSDIFLRQGSSLIFNLNNTLTISTPIEGDSLTTPLDNSGSLVKTGAGILKLNGANTYVGGTTIEQGSLQLNGSINGDLLIESRGTLLGNATVNGNINNNGIISPGNSIGTIFSTGLNLSSTSVYQVEIDPTSSDLLSVSGSAILGGTLQVMQGAGNYSRSGRYLLIKTTGGLSGSFASVVIRTLPGFQFTLEQDGYNLFLVYTFTPIPPTPHSPKNVHGRQKRHLSSCKRVNVIKWNRPAKGPHPTAYKIYRNSLDHRIGTVSAKHKLKFQDYLSLKKRGIHKYYVVSITKQKTSSSPKLVKIKPNKHLHKQQRCR